MSLELWCPLGIEARAARRAVSVSTVVARTGMGPRRAAAFARRRSVAGGDCDHTCAVVLGLSGAVTDALAPGDVVVADVVRGPGPERSVGASPTAAEAILAGLRRVGIAAVRGPVGSVARPATGPQRRRLGDDGSQAVDMESWWLLAAEPRPLAVVRVVCDTPAAELFSLSLPWRVRRALAVLARTVEPLEVWASAPGPDSHRGPALSAPATPGGSR